MLFCTSLVALVGAGEHPSFSPRRLQIANTKRQSTICELNFVNKVLAVKMNRKRLVVVLEDRIHIYDITNMKILHTVDTTPNVNGVCALSPNSDANYLAYPASTNDGNVLIFDSLNLQASSVMQAHKGPVTCMAFNYAGTMLATSSEKGTVIRVFSVPEAKKLYQFRRGSYPATIYSINFSIDSTRLCVSSSTDTVHIFKLDEDTRQKSSQNPPPRSTFSLSSYLPEMITEMWDPERSFASLKLPNAGSGIMNICALSSTQPQVMVVTADGNFYQFNIPKDGGECSLVRQDSIIDPVDYRNANDNTDTENKADPS